MKTQTNPVYNEVYLAYADCHMDWEKGSKIRNLNFKASETVSRDEAIEIFKRAQVDSYNNFRPELLKKFPADARIIIAREGSVCLYVQQMPGLPSAKTVFADERDVLGDYNGSMVRYWWD